MKKKVFVLLFVLCIVSALSGEDVVWGSMYDSGNIRLGIGAAVESSGTALRFSAYPEAEVLLWKPETGSMAFIDIGAAIAGRFGIPMQASEFSAGAGLFGTLHAGFRGFDFPGSEYLGNVDYYARAGFKFDFITSGTAFGAAFQTGINYFLTDSFSAGVYYSYWGTYSGGGLSFSLKLGDTPNVRGMKTAMSESTGGLAFNPYLMQFYTLYYSSNFAGGFYPESYAPGEETVYEISTIDSSGIISYTVGKSLFGRIEDGINLWGLEYRDDDDSFYFEYTADSEGQIGKVYYRNDDDELVIMDADAAVNPEAEYLRWEDYNAEKKSGVKVSIKAGRFDADEYGYLDASGVMINWCISDEVPGKLLSYKMEDDSDIVTTELIEVNKGRKPALYK